MYVMVNPDELFEFVAIVLTIVAVLCGLIGAIGGPDGFLGVSMVITALMLCCIIVYSLYSSFNEAIVFTNSPSEKTTLITETHPIDADGLDIKVDAKGDTTYIVTCVDHDGTLDPIAVAGDDMSVVEDAASWDDAELELV